MTRSAARCGRRQFRAVPPLRERAVTASLGRVVVMIDPGGEFTQPGMRGPNLRLHVMD
jgi:hypothetical protein